MIPAPIMITGLALQRAEELFESLNFVKRIYNYFISSEYKKDN